MEKEQKNQGFFNNSFVLGIILGVLITLLFSTKRGKRILKAITDEGLHKFADIETLMDDIAEEYTEQPFMSPSEPLAPVAASPFPVAQKEETIELPKKQKTVQKTHVSKRFFKGVGRKSLVIN